MQTIDIATAKAAKATDRRALAILAYDNATAAPDGANWRAVADLLRLALPATKAKGATVEASRFAPWADYDVSTASAKRCGKSPVVTVTFACGEIVRAPAVSLPGKPINIARALRVALAFYRARIARNVAGMHSDGSDCIAVPEIVAAVCDNGAEFDPADCNAKTAERRGGMFDRLAVAAAATAFPEAERAEFMRRRYFLVSKRAERADRVAAYLKHRAERAERKAAKLARAKAKETAAAEIAASKAEAAANLARALSPPVAPAFKVPPRLLSTSRLAPVALISRPRVAPSCVLRVVA